MITVSIQWRCAQELLKNGGQEVLQSVYGDLLHATPETGYDVSLRIDMSNPPANLAANVGLLTRHLFAGPFQRVFQSVEAGKPVQPILIEYRDQESVFIKPEGDRVIVIFSILFKDPDDQVIAKVFLQVRIRPPVVPLASALSLSASRRSSPMPAGRSTACPALRSRTRTRRSS